VQVDRARSGPVPTGPLHRRREETPMLWSLIVILLVLWVLGLATNVVGALIHVLLVIALIVLVFQLISGRRAV
jgi:hypothetical protein